MAEKLEIKLYRAILHTGSKSLDQIANEFDGPKPTTKELENWKSAYDLIEGTELVVTDGFSEGYTVFGWDEKSEEKMKEFVYMAEQDPMFGSYQDDREQFELDWESGEYEPPGGMHFDKNDVEIIEEIKRI